MDLKTYPVIDPVATGNNIRRLRMERGLTVRDLQSYFGFEEPRAIYKWQKGESLPTVDNLYALSSLFEIPMDQILVPAAVKLHMFGEQQAESCCSNHFMTGYFGYGKRPMQLQPSAPFALPAAKVRSGYKNIIILTRREVIELAVHCIRSICSQHQGYIRGLRQAAAGA